jgi:hypothetical protein
MKKITKTSILKDILKIKNASEVLEKFHLPCLHCPMAQQEITKLKIGEVAKAYGLDIENILRELNLLLPKKVKGEPKRNN